tara:strand:- start:245 stop:550 length:306 start_codon:yes stop_codon:yes gene_type:complete
MSENISNVDFAISYDNTKRLDLFFAQYEATSDFYDELSFISEAIGSSEEFTLPNGTTIEPDTTGGMVRIQLYMTLLQSRQDLVQGITTTGLNIEKKSWNMS